MEAVNNRCCIFFLCKYNEEYLPVIQSIGILLSKQRVLEATKKWHYLPLVYVTPAHNDGLLVLETRHKFYLFLLLKDFFACDD